MLSDSGRWNILWQKTSNKILKVHVEKIAKTKNKLWLRVTQLEATNQLKRKNDCGCELPNSNQPQSNAQR